MHRDPSHTRTSCHTGGIPTPRGQRHGTGRHARRERTTLHTAISSDESDLPVATTVVAPGSGDPAGPSLFGAGNIGPAFFAPAAGLNAWACSQVRIMRPPGSRHAYRANTDADFFPIPFLSGPVWRRRLRRCDTARSQNALCSYCVSDTVAKASRWPGSPFSLVLPALGRTSFWWGPVHACTARPVRGADGAGSTAAGWG